MRNCAVIALAIMQFLITLDIHQSWRPEHRNTQCLAEMRADRSTANLELKGNGWITTLKSYFRAIIPRQTYTFVMPLPRGIFSISDVGKSARTWPFVVVLYWKFFGDHLRQQWFKRNKICFQLSLPNRFKTKFCHKIRGLIPLLPSITFASHFFLFSVNVRSGYV